MEPDSIFKVLVTGSAKETRQDFFLPENENALHPLPESNLVQAVAHACQLEALIDLNLLNVPKFMAGQTNTLLKPTSFHSLQPSTCA